MEPWYRSPFRMFQTNLLEFDADMDVEKVLDFIQDFGCDAWLVNGGGILSFYPTKLEHQTRNPYLDKRPSGDLFGDAVEAGHRRGMRVLARMDFSKVSEAVADRHPDWLFVSPKDGGRQVMEGQVSVDPSSAYYQEKLFEVVDEMIDNYPLDGFFFNMFRFAEYDYAKRYHGVSQSESCRRGFAEFSGGKPLPKGPESPHYDLWRTYANEVTRNLSTRIAEHIKRRRPDACLLRSDDLVFFEANNEVGRELWHHHVNERVSAFRTQRPQRPVLCHCVTFIDMPYRIASEQPEHFAQHLIQGISRGANPSTYIMGVPGEIEYQSLGVAKEIVRFHRDNNEVYRGLTPAAHIGLVRPDVLATSMARYNESNAEFRGLYLSLQEKHLPFDVVPMEGIPDMASNGGLKRYSVLIVPDVSGLKPAAVQALDAFVASGGRLLLTGRSGFDENDLAQLAAMPAGRITERTTDPHALKSVYVTERAPEEGRRYFAPVSPVFGAHYRVEAKADSQGRLVFLPQAAYGPPEKSYGHKADGTPAYYLDGAGRVALVPWTVGRSYHELGLSTSRDIVADLVRELLGNDEPLSAELAEHIELTLQHRGNDLVIHLINLSGARRKNYGPHVTIGGGRLRLAGAAPSAKARALVAGTDCEATREGKDLIINLPDIERFEVVLIQEH
ncbi:alpha-amylase family protein [Microvirga sp. KLBC 81]|uniref:alpha-amylase family protein n=1 Tax=Microvirga sp. KLBC 81 TaxID=1862707 RepID=UPI001FE11E6C|nr:alpha-amylase family protein [Microvirga sp. KLBC 81]